MSFLLRCSGVGMETSGVRRAVIRRVFSFPYYIRSHFSAADLSPLLPTTKNEPRLPKLSSELEERIKPLADLWGVDKSLFLSHDRPSLSCLTKNQLLSVLSLPLPGEPGWNDEREKSCSAILPALYTAANAFCTRHHQDKVHYRGLLEFSNICRNDCLYCGIRKSFRVPRLWKRRSGVQAAAMALSCCNQGR